MINALIILYLTLFLSMRFGMFLARYTSISVWQLLLFVILFKIVLMSYGYK